MTSGAPTLPPRRGLRELAEITRLHAARFFAGEYPFVRFEPDERWHRRIYRDDDVDVWLLTWLPSQGTELHDHGGSQGAFTVLDGELTEFLPRLDRHGAGVTALVGHRRRLMSTTTFGARHVHDVVNRGRMPAVSVHAYSPPLTSMRFYECAGGTGLVVNRTVHTDHPEPALAGRFGQS
jgi:predicted metal-dependent enzyme (double-stranded beta helix superfamily)